jgi:hypothetical protein
MLSALAILAGAPAASAQDGRPGPAPSGSPDFYLDEPLGSVGVRGSWIFARAGSDIFSFLTSQLTLDKGDFRASGVAVDLAIALGPRVDVVGGFELARSASRSEYRDFVDNNRLPIEQTTSLSTINLTGTLRYALVPRGQAVGRLAWVPRRVVPYVGAGGGASWYKLAQTGDFVDFVDLSVFSDSFDSRGWSPSVHAVAGVDLQLYRRLFATVETRYVRSSAALGQDFVDFEPIDLSGLRTSAGINFRF